MMDRSQIDLFKSIIQRILDRVHTIDAKKQIIENPDGLQFADPYYGDSQKNIHQKRAHLYYNSMYVVCYDNEGYKKPFLEFCKDFDERIDLETKVKIHKIIEENISYDDYKSGFISPDLTNLIPLDEFLKFTKNGGLNLYYVQEIDFNSEVGCYLYDRGFTPEMCKDIYQGFYKRSETWLEPVCVFMNKKVDKILGIQIRNLKSDKYRMYKIYNYEDIYTEMYPDRFIDTQQLIVYNKISYYFNILNVNLMRKVTVLEGFLDSKFYPNSIGMVGVNTDIRFLEENNVETQYLLDNDEAGHKKAAKLIQKGSNVFLWNKLIESIIESKKECNPYELRKRLNNIKDLNKLATIIKNPYYNLKLDNFYSKDKFDIKWINKYEWKPRKKYNTLR